ncbi:MAG: ABC transporter ATP-binding protein [Rhodospirillales bacterium]|nr:ABC transporter ATP-binding protein [Rhodospirillales bacterium]
MGLRLEGVSHAYDGVDVVRDVSLAVAPGEVAALLGPSGCGKTTLLRLAAGLEVLRRGRISIGGQVIADGRAALHTPPERRSTGLMFQDYALFPHLTVLENVVFGIRGRRERRRTWAPTALARVGLQSLANAYPHTLSGGEQQRCALLRALAPEPHVLLLDEPFSGLDVTRRAQVREETLVILRDSGAATLIVTHDPEEAMFMADILFVLDRGRIAQSGAPADIYLHPASEFVATLFGPINRLDCRVTDGRVGSPLGAFAAPGIAHGARARVLIRPEAILMLDVAATDNPDRDDASLLATVDDSRLLGRSSQLRLAVQGLAAPLQALVPGVVLPARGTGVHITIDPRLVFVFSQEPA